MYVALMHAQDVIKTRVQTWDLLPYRQAVPAGSETQPLLGPSAVSGNTIQNKPSTFQIARHAYYAEGASVFFRGLGICSARAFIVNAVQWAVSTPPSGGFRKLTQNRSTNG